MRKQKLMSLDNYILNQLNINNKTIHIIEYKKDIRTQWLKTQIIYLKK